MMMSTDVFPPHPSVVAGPTPWRAISVAFSPPKRLSSVRSDYPEFRVHTNSVFVVWKDRTKSTKPKKLVFCKNQVFTVFVKNILEAVVDVACVAYQKNYERHRSFSPTLLPSVLQSLLFSRFINMPFLLIPRSSVAVKAWRSTYSC